VSFRFDRATLSCAASALRNFVPTVFVAILVRCDVTPLSHFLNRLPVALQLNVIGRGVGVSYLRGELAVVSTNCTILSPLASVSCNCTMGPAISANFFSVS
jgi:hypothetical protein